VQTLVDELLLRGFARVGPLLATDEIERFSRRADDLMLGRIRHEGFFFQKDTESGRYDDLEYGKGWQGPSLDYRKLEKLELDPELRTVIHHPRLEAIARAAIEGPIAIYRAALFNKPASGGTVLPWHQDAGSMWGIDRAPTLQAWIALDDAPVEAGCVEVLEGSHRQGLATALGGLVPEAIIRARGDEGRIVALPARAGEAILLHNLAWHRSGINTTNKPRRAISIAYISAKTRCLRRRKTPRTFYLVWP
jgi:phytanoyl-CoA dioxygenase PhyH